MGSRTIAAAVAAGTFIGSVAMAQNTSTLRIAPADAGKVDATIAWLAQAAQGWDQGKPTFEIKDDGSPLAAKGWLATTDAELLIRLDVSDPVHLNTKTGDGIWDGDFIRIAVDGKGDGTAGGTPDTAGLVGPDDASIGFALTPTGAQGHTYGTTNPKMAGTYPADLLNFSRDEAAKVTRYNIRIPWERLGVRPGVFPRFGIVVQVRDINKQEQREPVHIRWGDGANEPKPGLFRKVALGNPPHELIAAAPGNGDIWEKGDRAEIVVAVASAGDVTISAQGGNQQQQQAVKGQPDLAIRRFIVSYTPSQVGEKLQVQVKGANASESASVDITVADAIVRQFIVRLEELIPQAEHPLFARHLRSVKAMVEAEWSRASLYKKTNAALARETLGYIRSMAAGFEGDSAKWESYLKDGRPLFMAYVSPRDGTLQWYTLTLPKGWDAAKGRDEQPAYPLFFELHGAGNPHYLNGAAAQLGTGETGLQLLGYERPRTYAAIQRNGYHVLPYGRGNSGYRDIGATDVWEAYNDVHKLVKIDPDRRYLYGFSMGGSGTWLLGSRTPDRWASMAILGMGATVGTWGQAENVANIPIFIWGGETDNIAYRAGAPKDMIQRFKEAVEKAGGSVDASTTPDMGHNYSGEVQERSTNWLQKYTRKRPAKFAFTADMNEYRGIWGITMERDPQVSPFPRFACTIEGQTVRIDTKGTAQVNVVLGERGLQMQGEVTVVLNGKEAYKGPAERERALELKIAKADLAAAETDD